MQQEGKKVSEIRRYIDEHYQSYGKGTDTPMPPDDL